jgi:hypothetical protein
MKAILAAMIAPFLVAPAGSQAFQRAATDTIWDSQTWTLGGSPYVVDVELVVGSGGMLTIDPGVLVELTPGGAILVEGTLEAVGAEEQPIQFTRADPQEPWKAIVNLGGGDTRLEHCVVEGGSVWGPYDIGVVGGFGGTLTVLNCHVFDVTNELIHASANTVLDVRGNVVHDGDGMALRFSFGCSGLVQGNTIYNARDGMNIDGCAPLDILDNIVYDCVLDGIDFDGSQGMIAGNIVHHVSDAGYTISWAGKEVIPLENNLGYACGRALQVKNASAAIVYNCTFANSTRGVEAIEFFKGDGGGIVDMRNSIVWGNTISYYVDEHSVLDAMYCDIEMDQGIYPGVGNINADPLFRSPAVGNFDIQAFSPCIDAATSAGAPQYDIHGDARWDDPDVPDTGGGLFTYYDIGCDEYRGESAGVPSAPVLVSSLQLGRAYPNPFRRQTTAVLRLLEADEVTALVVRVDGRRVRTLAQGREGPGEVRLAWDGTDDRGARVGSGAYFLIVNTKKDVTSLPPRRLLLVR